MTEHDNRGVETLDGLPVEGELYKGDVLISEMADGLPSDFNADQTMWREAAFIRGYTAATARVSKDRVEVLSMTHKVARVEKDDKIEVCEVLEWEAVVKPE